MAQKSNPDTGLQTQLAQHSAQIRTIAGQSNSHNLLDYHREMTASEKDYWITGQRPFMQDTFNTIFQFQQVVRKDPRLTPNQKLQIINQLNDYQAVAEQIMQLDVKIQSKINEFDLQIKELTPISEEILRLTDAEVDRAQATNEQVSRTVTTIMVLAALVSIGLTIFIARTLNQSITKNIVKLTRVAGQLEAGELTATARIDSSDELGQLAASFNSMAAQINSLVNNLEQQVADRTQQLETVLAETETVARISRQMVVTATLDNLIAALVENLNIPAINRAILMVFEYDNNNYVDELEIAATWYSGHGTLPSPVGSRYQQTDLETANIFASSKPLFFENVQTDARTDPSTKAFFQRIKIKALAVLPLLHGGRQSGVLVLQGEEPYQFSEREIAPYLSTLGQLAAAVENKRLFEQTQQRANELSHLNQIARQVSLTTELQAVLEIVAENLLALFNLSNVVISLVDETKQNYTPVVHKSTTKNKSPVPEKPTPLTRFGRQVIESGKAVVLSFSEEEKHVPRQIREQLEPWHISCLMGVSLRTRGDILGLISMGTDQPGRLFSSHEMELAETIANQIAGAIENARLFEEEQRQRRLAEQATEAAKAANQAKSIFLANMSHELRTPLNAVLGFAQIIKRNPNLPEQEKERLDIIGQSGEHLLDLINDILEISKIEAGQDSVSAENFNLFLLLSDLERMLRVRADKKGLNVILKRTGNVPRFIKSDERKLRQVLINLLGNAIKFTEQGQITLAVSTGSKHELPQNMPSSAIMLQFAVSDTGAGIAPEEMPKLFKPFSQTQTGLAAAEGSGLGLAISHHFVQLMGGLISVNSNVEQGTTFTVTIPVETGEDTQAIPASQSTRQITGLESGQPEYNILIVDDNQANRTLLRNLMEEVGFVTKEAENGQQGVELFETWKPHLILMDIRMPVMNGYEATQKIKATARGQATTIIAVTASAFETDRQMILSSGCDDFIRKPFKASELYGTISQHLGVRYNYASPPQMEIPSEHPISPTQLSPQDLKALPPETLARLHHVVRRGEIRGTKKIIAQIQANHPALAQQLEILAQEFDFEKLMELTQTKSP